MHGDEILALESCYCNLNGCPLRMKHNYYLEGSLCFSPMLDILFSILHVFVDLILLCRFEEEHPLVVS